MAFHYLWFICISTLVVFVSSITINPDVQGCSLVGLDLQRCFIPNPKTPFSIDSCCKILNQAIQAGYYCLCSLLSTSSYPVITKELALYFSNCYISVPSLTHCHGPHSVLNAPPHLPRLPVLAPPDLSRDDPPVPQPPKENENALNSNSSIDKNPNLSSRSLPKMSNPKHTDHVSSDGVYVKIIIRSRNLLIITVLACIA